MFRKVPKQLCALAALGASALATLPLCAQATQYNLEAALGIDSNPAQARKANTMAFAQYNFSAREGIPLERESLALSVDGHYRDLEGDLGNQRVQLAAHWSHPLGGGGRTLSWSLAAGMYRDQLVPADERNEALIGLELLSVLSPRIDLNLSARLAWLDYINPSQPWTGRPGGNSSRQVNARGKGGNPGAGLSAVQREDVQGNLGIESTWYFSADLDVSIRADYQVLDSQVALENYRQVGIDINTRWLPAPRWQTQLGLAGYRRDYDGSGMTRDRIDERFSVEGSLSHFVGDIEIYLRAAFADNHSTLRRMRFKQTITELGIGWAF